MAIRGRILVVDDEEHICDAITKALERIGYSVEIALDAPSALEKFDRGSFEMVLCDIKLPGMDGIQLLDRIKEADPETIVLMITGYSSIESAVDSIKRGAQEYIPKPFTPDQIRLIVNRAFEQKQLLDENAYLRGELKGLRGVVVGESRAMREVFDLALKMAGSNTTVLILGESGTGKEVVARFIHFNSPRAGRPFGTVNCAAIAENLLESELFGHRRGAFTGALYTKRGSFELANGGTLFLDEIGEMRLGMQAKILRALEERKIRRVGSEEDIDIDVRVIAASNKDLELEVKAGHFREDLFYRLNVVQIKIPPLRDHKGDIPLLARHFLKMYREQLKKPVADFSEQTMAFMTSYDWPGNIRELRNAVERAVIFAETGKPIRLPHLPPQIHPEPPRNAASASKPFPTLQDIELQYIHKVLEACAGNRTRAAEILGISPVTLWRKLGKESGGEKGG
ncbi:MAG: sigma-54-dependent transcriptional regulator [Candidatus Methylomirabilales bacterium]